MVKQKGSSSQLKKDIFFFRFFQQRNTDYVNLCIIIFSVHRCMKTLFKRFSQNRKWVRCYLPCGISLCFQPTKAIILLPLTLFCQKLYAYNTVYGPLLLQKTFKF